MQKNIKDVQETYQAVMGALKRLNQYQSAITATCELITPGLESVLDNHANYFKLDNRGLRDVIDSRETTIESTINIIRNLEDLSMNIGQERISVEDVVTDLAQDAKNWSADYEA